MISLQHYIDRVKPVFPELETVTPWMAVTKSHELITGKLALLDGGFVIKDHIAIHQSARIDPSAVLKGPAIISANCFIGANCLVRGGVFLDENVSLGPGCEVKSSFIFSNSALGHFNFVGDSILGSHVNMEAGAIIANHFNERTDKSVFVLLDGKIQRTGVEKFGALAGDHTRIGANAVLSPGTILAAGTVVRRLQLIEQCPEGNLTDWNAN